MCTVIVLRDVHPAHRLIVAANRDEWLGRPSSGPRVLVESPRIVGGEDGERHGTWMAVAPSGMLAALTNFRGGGADKAKRSRGELAIEALRAGGVEEARRVLAGRHARDYNPFNLLCGDATGAWVAYGRDDVTFEDVPPGVHVLSNDRLDAPSFARVPFARDAAAKVATLPWDELVAELRVILADHGIPGMHSICIHTPTYGTRSSSIVATGAGGVAKYLFAEGPPCTTPYEDVTALVAA